jgi:hypothetical protein
MRQRLTYIALFAGVGLLGAQTVGPKTFASPEEARDALVQAASKGLDAMREMMGPGSTEILRTGDEVQNKALLEQFKHRIAEKTQLEPDQMNPDRVTLVIGQEAWPFAVPLMRKNGRWIFDVQEGKAEIRRRIIGANELDAIEVCRGYVEAQLMYSETDWNKNGKLEYAAKIASTPGKKDGLYWPGGDSPVSEGIARAMAEGYPAPTNGIGKGYHGYHYKILLAQGANALDGEQDYVVHGLVIGGFALVAWPVEYGVSGIMTFTVNQDGVVYQKDLGAQTGALARAMTKFNPDKSWSIPPE